MYPLPHAKEHLGERLNEHLDEHLGVGYLEESQNQQEPPIKEDSIQSMIASYVDLLILQYKNQPNAKKTIELLARTALCDLIFLDVIEGFDINTAVGAQLDILGKYIGIQRFVLDVYYSNHYFGTVSYGSDPITYDSYGYLSLYATHDHDTVLGTPLFSYFDSTGTLLNDEDYRVLCQLQLLKNTLNATTGNIQNILHEFFPPTLFSKGKDVITMQDNQDMSLTFTIHDPSHTRIFHIANSLNLLPTPMGVRTIVH